MNTKELLETYYRGLATKAGWELVIADDFEFVGGDMTKTEPTVGKAAYVETIRRFGRLFGSMQVAEMIVEGDRAYVCGRYDYAFPNGVRIAGDVAEIWRVRGGKLAALRIFFDTATFQANLKPPAAAPAAEKSPGP